MSSPDESLGIRQSGETASPRSAPSMPPPGFRAYDAPAGTPGFKDFAASSAAARGVAPKPTMFQRNRTTLTTLAVVAVYLALAMSTGIVLLGIFPVMLGIRALQRKEQLAPLAILAAAGAVVFSLSVIAHR